MNPFQKDYKLVVKVSDLRKAHDEYLEATEKALQRFIKAMGVGLASMCDACETEQPDVKHSVLFGNGAPGLCHDCFGEWFDGAGPDKAKIKEAVERKRAEKSCV